jgi:hypothetical protein
MRKWPVCKKLVPRMPPLGFPSPPATPAATGLAKKESPHFQLVEGELRGVVADAPLGELFAGQGPIFPAPRETHSVFTLSARVC